MSKIVFFDIDGTLLDHDKKLPISTKKALAQLKENGIYVAIATGRAPFMFKDLREELEIETFVSFNGQYVVFENEVIYQNPLNTNELELLLTHSSDREHPLVFLNEETMKSSVPHHPFIETSMGSLKFTHPEQDSEFFRNHDTYQTLLFCDEKHEELYLNQYSTFRFIRWHPYSVDVLPKGGSKAEGIKKLIRRLNFKLEDVYAFGDGLNDIEMLETVGTGVAMGNGVNIVKESADFVTKSVEEDGILYGLKKLNLL